MTKLLLISLVALFAGCAKLAHINELLTLKGVADEQTRNDKLVKEYDAKFATLISAQKNNALTQETKKSILQKYIEPIYTETVDLDGVPSDRWVYRPYVKYFNSEQVRLYFDSAGKLIKSEYLPAGNAESKSASDAQASNPAP